MTSSRLAPLVATVLALSPAACSAAPDNQADPCELDDADGVMGGEPRVFQVTVDDDGFTPRVFSAQNRAEVTLTLKNAGTRPHGFKIECVQTPNDDGCQEEWCFPESSTIPPIEPGAEASTEFEVPLYEEFYPVVSGAEGDEFEAQFVVQ